MLYGNGCYPDFIGSGMGVWVDKWPRSGTADTQMLPVIFSPTSGFKYPNCGDAALYVARASIYDDDSAYRGYQINKGDLETTYSAYSDYTGPLTIAAFTGTFAYPFCDKPHSGLYKCLNWWEFTNTPTDISTVPSAHIDNFNGTYGGYSMTEVTAWKGLARKDIYAKPGVTITPTGGGNTDTFTTFKVETTLGMPEHMGGCMLFSANDNFDGSKLVGVGLKGLVHYNITGDRGDDIYYKLYRFGADDGYFRSIGNNCYIFNDPNIVAVKGQNSSNGPFSFCYSGPFFVQAGLSAGRYTNSSKTRYATLNIGPASYIAKPTVLTSISYLSTGYDTQVTSAKPIGSLGIGNSDYQCRLRLWNDVANDTVYYSLAPFAPGVPIGISYSVHFYINNNIKELGLGSTLSAFGSILRNNGLEPLSELTAVNGTWDYCYNVTYNNAVNRLFTSASKLVKIPSSWHGLQNLECTDINNMFYECNSLTAIPSSFKDFGDGTKITQAYSCFSNCYNLEEGLKSWEGLDSVERADYFFYNCQSLKYIPDTFEHLGNLQSISYMFYNCKTLPEIKSWYGLQNKLQSMYSAFALCENLTAIPDKWFGPISAGFSMFNGCSRLPEIKSWNNIEAIHDAAYMFYNCTALTAIPSSWDGLNTKINSPYMFAECHNLKSIPTSAEWDKLFRRLEQNNNVSDCSQNSIAYFPDIFYNCTELTADANISQVFANHKVPHGSHFHGCTNMPNYAYYSTKEDTSAYF